MAKKIAYFRPAYLAAKPSKADPQAAQRAEDARFYAGSPWRKLRKLKLDHDPLCERCEKAGVTEVAVHVHHIRARKQFPELAMDLDNLEALCHSCHSRLHKTKPKG
jgi:5-methylcytosine-specific restriction endonuclease McrA